MKTQISSKVEIDNKRTDLLTDVSDLKTAINTTGRNLLGISSYDGLDIGGAGLKLSNNLKTLLADIETDATNIDTFITDLLEIDNDEEGIETVDTTVTADIVPSNSFIPEDTTNLQVEQNTVYTVSQTYYAEPSTDGVKLITLPSTPVQPVIVETTPEIVIPSTPDPVESSDPVDYGTPAENNGGPIDISKYKNLPEKGFVVTTGNTVYNVSDEDYNLLCAIVSAESDKSYDDALAVITTILNRCEAPNWVASFGTNPVKQATAPNQFVVYQHGSYKKYLGNAPDTVRQAVSDALAGVRNHQYLSFRSNGSTGYSNNMISPSGNRYK